ncbi:hypothetical protein V6439_002367 [Vibrio parahaemolyticus]
MASKQDILEIRKSRSAEITKQIRLMAFGIIALVYTTLSSSSDFSTKLAAEFEVEYIIILIFCSVSIAADYLQSVSGYITAINVDLDEPNENGKYEYNHDSKSYKCTKILFYTKQLTLGIAIFQLICIMLKALI